MAIVTWLIKDRSPGRRLCRTRNQFTVESAASELVLICLMLTKFIDTIEFMHEQGVIHRDLKPEK
jgi:serine/threonine protein kinase